MISEAVRPSALALGRRSRWVAPASEPNVPTRMHGKRHNGNICCGSIRGKVVQGTSSALGWAPSDPSTERQPCQPYYRERGRAWRLGPGVAQREERERSPATHQVQRRKEWGRCWGERDARCCMSGAVLCFLIYGISVVTVLTTALTCHDTAPHAASLRAHQLAALVFVWLGALSEYQCDKLCSVASYVREALRLPIQHP